MSSVLNDKIVLAKTASGAATTEVTSDVIDSAGYQWVRFMCVITTSNAGNYVKVQQGTIATMSDAADLAGTRITPSADNMLASVTVFRPLERYLRMSVIRAGASSTLSPIIAVVGGSKVVPQSSDVAGAAGVMTEYHVSPSEGTA